MKLEGFEDVLTSIKKNPKRPFHLLLGNGFSVAYDAKIFSYNALHDFVANLKDPDLSKVLDVIGTRNFEVIMQHLDHCSALIGAFDGNSQLKQRIEAASAKLKKSLLEAVKSLHPEHVFAVSENQSKAAAVFLSKFFETGGSIFSTNYDLLLYWVLMRNEGINHIDGCGREREDGGGEFVPLEEQVWSELLWGPNRDDQNVFYLHGALQFFDAGATVVKEQYSNEQYLLKNISDRMNKGQYPIFVTAGDGDQKLTHITHNQYLTACYDALCNIEGSLVTFGFSFGAYDEHIIEAINRAAKKSPADRLWSLYVGVYNENDKHHIESIADRFQCKVRVYNAASAKVWG